MRNLKLALALAASLIASACPALAQNEFKTPTQGKTVVGFQVLCQNSSGQAVTCGDASNPLQIAGTFSAALGGFTPSASGARGTPIAVTVADSSGTLPSGTVVDVSNVGSNPMYCNVNGVPATTADKLIAANSWFEFTIPAGGTLLHCIATGGSTTANMVGGSGLGTGAGGGSSGGGSGGNVNLTQIAGAAPSLSNPLWVFPATGATFPVSNAGAFPVQLNATPSLVNGNGVVPTQGGAVLSATNGIFANLLQGNAVLSTTNPIFDRLTDGTTAIVVKAASTAAATTDPALVVAVSPNNVLPIKIASGQVASGAFASGSIGSGAYAAGAFAAGAGVDGWDLTQGAIADAAVAAGATGSVSAKLRAISRDIGTVATNSALPLPTQAVTVPIGGVTNDPCQYATKINFTFATSSGTVQIVAPSGSTQVHICSLFSIGATASIQNIVGGTGANCTTGTPVAMAGSTTAASGMSFAANGGFTFGNGGGTVLRTTTAGHGVCLIQSATAAIAGGGTFVQQ